MATNTDAYPLVVDLDGTLIQTDILHETAVQACRNNPLKAFLLPLWLAKGKAVLKQHLASLADFHPETLPFNESLLTWLRQEKNNGRKLILCTASDQSIADLIAKHLDLFDDVIASDGKTNLSGQQKAQKLINLYGKCKFDYVGNAKADLKIWQHASKAILVNASKSVIKQAKQICEVECCHESHQRFTFSLLRRVLRLHQWLKNLLLFVPILAAHQIANSEIWQPTIIAFFSFCFCASAVYVTNDLFDLENDRKHPRKRKRPFASGEVPIWIGALLIPILLTISVILALQVDGAFIAWLIIYFVITCLYSWSLKRFVLLDCLTLATLYTLRIIAGVAAIQLEISFWLLSFAIFTFLSLAFLKRYAEIELSQTMEQKKLHGRGYHTSDAPLIQAMGIASGYVSVLVLALYLNSESVLELYKVPEFIWFAIPVYLYWISWMWLQAHRGKMHDDPIVYATKDKVSILSGAIFACVLFAGTTGLPWLS